MLKNVKVGFAMTGSFCTIRSALIQLQNLVNEGAIVVPIVSNIVYESDSRFISNAELMSTIKNITGLEPIGNIIDAEPIGPKNLTDIVVVAPCTGNTLAKLANGITDTAVTMAAKANLRNGNPVVLSLATNDALGANATNIGALINTKGFYFVPFNQDDYEGKPRSMIANLDLLVPTIVRALAGEQYQPLF